MIINLLFVIALTFPVAVTATAFNAINKKQWKRNIMFALILSLGQGVMYSLGSLLGGTFMHLLVSLSKWVVLALCFSVSFRMLINTIKIKNGKTLLFLENKKQLLLLSIALGMNSFIVGLLSEFFLPFNNLTPYIIIAVAFIWAIISLLIPFSKTKLTFNSLLNIIFSAIILVRGFIFMLRGV